MAIASLGSLGSTSNKTANQASTTHTTTTTALSIGDFAVVVVAVDNHQTAGGEESGAVTVSDSAGNTWSYAISYTNGRGAAQGGATVSIWYSTLTAAMPVGTVITATFTNSTSRDASAITAWGFSRDTSKVLAIEGVSVVSDTGADPSSLNVSTANIACLRLRGIAAETASTATFTTTAGWTALTQASTGGGLDSSNMSVRGEFIISTATGAASDPTYTAVDCASGYVALKEIPPQRAFPNLTPINKLQPILVR